MELSTGEVQHLTYTLEACRVEFEELVLEKEWYVTEVLDLIESSLEILKGI